MDLIKIKNLCSVEDAGKGLKGQITDYKKILANHIANQRLLCRINNLKCNSKTKKKKSN